MFPEDHPEGRDAGGLNEIEPLEAEKIQAQIRRYIDQHGWAVADDEGHWRQYQQARMAEEYRDEDW